MKSSEPVSEFSVMMVDTTCPLVPCSYTTKASQVPRGTGSCGRSQGKSFSKHDALIAERRQQRTPRAGELRTPHVEHKVDAIQDVEGVFCFLSRSEHWPGVCWNYNVSDDSIDREAQ